MRFGKTLLAALMLALLFIATVSAQDTEREKRRITQPTVTGATGLFTVYDASTLKKGEFNVGFFANNYDRDPGDVDIMQYPVNFAVGITDKLELFVNTDTYQRLISNAPFELSGTLFPGLTQPQGTFGLGGIKTSFPGIPSTDPRFFPLNGAPVSGALVGGILPGLPQTGSIQIFDQATGRNKPGFAVPGYLNDFPFLGKGGGGVGNVTYGAKYRFTSQDAPVGLAVVGWVRSPTVFAASYLNKERGGRLAQGSGAGATDFGIFLVSSLRKSIVSTHFNFGFVHANDPQAKGFKLLDRSDSVVFAGGIDVPVTQYAQLIGEGSFVYYIGDATPNLNRVNPADVVVGARFFPFGNKEKHRILFSLGGGYRYFLNNSGGDDERGKRLAGVLATGLVDPTAIANSRNSDYNGFVAHLTFGLRGKTAPKPQPMPVAAKDPCDGAAGPSVELNAERLAVKERSNDKVKFKANANGDGLTYTWTATGGRFVDNGDNERTWTSEGLTAGNYNITVTVTDKCNKTKTETRSVAVEKANRCPIVKVTGSPNSVQEGADATFNFTANASDPDGDRLTYTWTTSKGSLSGSDTAKQLNTSGLTAGAITVKVTVTDGQCSETSSTTVEITPRPVAPLVFSTSCNTYKTANDSRPDNACKRVLDDVAAKLQSDRNAILLIDGHSDKGEKAGTAKTRAERVRDYLVNQAKVDPGRIEIRSYDSSRPDPSGDRNLNRRVILHVVPQGAVRPQ